MADLLIDGLGKTYQDGVVALAGVDLAVNHGEVLALLGPSGSGKTTLLRLVAGLEKPTSGRVVIGGREVTGLRSATQGVGFVFQDGALYPHLSAGDNMAFPLEVAREQPAEIARQVGDVAESLGLHGQLERAPAELAAGHRQGVATGRALLGGREVMLMDEPMANLDAPSRVKLHRDLMSVKAERACTIVYVTNDQAEAMTLADRVAVLDGGRIQQVAEPMQVYRWPANLMVAGFVGSPPMNFALGTVVADGEGVEILLGSRSLRLDAERASRWPGLSAGRRVVVGIRPEDLHYGPMPGHSGREQRLGGEIVFTEFLGRTLQVGFSFDASSVVGSTGVEFVATLPGDVAVTVGTHIGLAVNLDRLRFFDPDSGEALACTATEPGRSS